MLAPHFPQAVPSAAGFRLRDVFNFFSRNTREVDVEAAFRPSQQLINHFSLPRGLSDVGASTTIWIERVGCSINGIDSFFELILQCLKTKFEISIGYRGFKF